MANRKMEKYTPFIPEEAECCTRSGLIPGDEVIPDGSDICWAYKFVDKLPDLGESPQRICIPSVDLGAFKPGEVLTVKSTGDSLSWVRLNGPEKGVGVPTDINCIQSADDTEIRLRWKDPVNVGRYVWHKTRVLKKNGGYPANENDGVIVGESTLRDQYKDDWLIDHRPSNITGTWWYRIFAYSADGVVASDSTCCVQPKTEEFGTEMSSQIQDGYAQLIFHIGDEINVNGIRFMVAGFDMSTPTTIGKKRSVMLVSKTPVVTNLAFDNPHPTYVLVEDEIAPVKGTKTYYKLNASTGKYVPYPVDTGTHITADLGIYVKETNIDSTKYGCNYWANSSSRKYLNTTWLNMLKAKHAGFGSMILNTESQVLNETNDTVRLPTLEQMQDITVTEMTGWTMTPDINTSYSLYLRYTSYGKIYEKIDYAYKMYDSHVVIHIG